MFSKMLLTLGLECIANNGFCQYYLCKPCQSFNYWACRRFHNFSFSSDTDRLMFSSEQSALSLHNTAGVLNSWLIA